MDPLDKPYCAVTGGLNSGSLALSPRRSGKGGTARPNHPPRPPQPNAGGPAQPSRPPNGSEPEGRGIIPGDGQRPGPSSRQGASLVSWPVLPAFPDPQLPCGWCWRVIQDAAGIAKRRDEGAPLTRNHQPSRQFKDRDMQTDKAKEREAHRVVAFQFSASCAIPTPVGRPYARNRAMPPSG
jgi:hypothetical protein